MSSIVDYLFATGGFAPHGYCLSWREDLVAVHVGSDAAIAMAYFSIPFALLVFMRQRVDLEYKWILGLFAAFITLCGLTHLSGLVTLWAPYYGLDGMIKLATALVSVATAVICWPLIPRLLAIPSPTQLRAANADLQAEIARHGETMAELRRARDELEARVEARTAELRRSNRILDGFVHIASHDLREPLRGIRNFAAILEDDAAERLTEEDRTHLATISRLTDRMQQLISDLRTFSRLERTEPPTESVPLREVVDDALDMLGERIRETGARIAVADDLPAVRCNRANMVVVMQNLVANAIKYTDRPPPEIEIGWRGTPEWPEVYVRDRGIGVDPGDAERIFDMFKRLHPRDAFGGGTGAGLAIVRRVMDLKGGSVRVESAPGEGSTFWLRFARQAGPEPAGAGNSDGRG